MCRRILASQLKKAANTVTRAMQSVKSATPKVNTWATWQICELMWQNDDVTLKGYNIKWVDPAQLTIEDVNISKLPATSVLQSVLFFNCEDMRPLNVVENEEFRNMMKTSEPPYTITAWQHITDIALPKLYKKVKVTVLDSLSSTERVARTSRATELYITLR